MVESARFARATMPSVMRSRFGTSSKYFPMGSSSDSAPGSAAQPPSSRVSAAAVATPTVIRSRRTGGLRSRTHDGAQPRVPAHRSPDHGPGSTPCGAHRPRSSDSATIRATLRVAQRPVSGPMTRSDAQVHRPQSAPKA